MKISTRGTYALRVLCELAKLNGDEYMCLGTLCEKQRIPRKYLDRITPLLLKGGLLKTQRGSCGGCALALPPEQISVAQVLRLTEGSLAPVPCLRDSECDHCGRCPAYPVWQGLENVVTDYLSGISIAQLIEGKDGEADE